MDDHYKSFIKLIKWASNRSSKGLTGRYDYWDFFESGLETLALCMVKWKEKGFTFEGEDGISFKKYFKTALFNKFKQIQALSFGKKRMGAHISLPRELAIAKNRLGAQVQVVDLLSGDGGFGEVFFKELCTHVASFLPSTESKIFFLIVDPPEDLATEAVLNHFKKQKFAIIAGNSHKNKAVRVTYNHLFRYVNENVETISKLDFLGAIESIKETVNRICNSKFRNSV